MHTAHSLTYPIDHSSPGWRQVRSGWLRPLTLQAVGLLTEGAAVAALGYLAMAMGIVEKALREPAFVAAGYVLLVVAHNSIAAPPRSAKIWPAIRLLASAFICLAIIAASSRP